MKIPTYEWIQEKFDSGSPLSRIEEFIHNYEPAGDGEDFKWRLSFEDALQEAANGAGEDAPCNKLKAEIAAKIDHALLHFTTGDDEAGIYELNNLLRQLSAV